MLKLNIIKLCNNSLVNNTVKRLNSNDFYVANNVKLRQGVRKYPLSGIKVALLNRPTLGDFTAKILEDYGAQVFKYCEPLGSFKLTEKHGQKIDLTKAQDVNLIKSIARKVDIIIDSLNGGRLEETGIIPENLLKVNSSLIIARITGYGQTGTYGSKTGADTTYGALSGAMSGIHSTTEESLAIARREAVALTMAGRSNCVTGLILALYDREHTGRGQIVDMSVTESIAYIDRVRHLKALEIPRCFHRFYVTSDEKLLSVGILNPTEQEEFLKLINVDCQDDIEKAIADKIKTKTLSDWLSKLNHIGTVTEVFNHNNVGQHKQHRDREAFDFDEKDNVWVAKSVPKFIPQ